MRVPPETRYARSGEVSIAYQVTSSGSFDLVYVPVTSQHIELNWEKPPVARFLSRLGSLGRLIVFDKRGTGMSDRVVGSPTLEARMDDIRAVMDAADSDRAVLFGVGDGGQLCLLFAATYPERTRALVLWNTPPRFSRSADLPFLRSRGEQEQFYDELDRLWGEPGFVEQIIRQNNPDTSDEEVSAFARVSRLSVSPGAVAQYNRMNLDVDVSEVLPAVRVPTLIFHRPDSPTMDGRVAAHMATRIPNARVVELPGRNTAPPLGDQEPLFAELERFLSVVPEGEPEESSEAERVLATVLFTDIVGATAAAAELGDQGWRELLTAHHDRTRRELARYRGREVDTAGDGFFATFDGPARAIHCACAASDAVRELGVDIRAGLHTGECELVHGKVGGLAVHIGARVAGKAEPGEVLVSSTVKDLVAGSGIEFNDRGTHELKGVPGKWHLYSIAR
ncbi:MAG: adenylate/guanylate cyclase domain-containing protein [Actinobacteria bacterium]|nr:MAG: adenylate/guanylate cyclase domain-containing protein [Actinomycetota bacterium]